MKRFIRMILSGSALALLHGTPALGAEKPTVSDSWGTKPIVSALRAGQAQRSPSRVSSEDFARWEATQTNPAVQLLRAERERRNKAQAAPERATVASACWGTKPVMWTLGRCGEVPGSRLH